jgi:3-deoxy-7-phosphoheptulonate synthase
MAQQWTPSSWQERPAAQQPAWPDDAALDQVLKELSTYPPLVFAGEARNLTAALGGVAGGRAFLLRRETAPSRSRHSQQTPSGTSCG